MNSDISRKASSQLDACDKWQALWLSNDATVANRFLKKYRNHLKTLPVKSVRSRVMCVGQYMILFGSKFLKIIPKNRSQACTRTSKLSR
jgi:hypothetical protein